jgi:hypothetical protein
LRSVTLRSLAAEGLKSHTEPSQATVRRLQTNAAPDVSFIQ